MIDVVVKFFGPLRDVVGCDEMRLSVSPPFTGEAAFEVLSSRHPEVGVWKSSLRLAVNLEYVDFSKVLHEGDEVCFVPPVSGG
jgi:molybdopterin converting factor small subunit